MTHDIGGVTALSNACIWRIPMPPAPTIRCSGFAPSKDSMSSCTALHFPRLNAVALVNAKRYLEKLQSDAFHERRVAVTQLAGLGPAVIPLLYPILHSGRWSAQLDGALDVLKQIGDSRALPEVTLLLDSPCNRTRLASVRALRWLSDDPDMFMPTLTDTSWRVRREAVFALVELRSEELGPVFESMLRDRHPKVRSAAANALGILGAARYTHAIIQLLDDPSEDVRAMAGWTLSRLSGHTVAETIRVMLHEPCSSRDVVLAARALSGCADQTLATTVLVAAAHADDQAQCETVKAVAPYGNPEHLPFLEAMLHTGSDTVRRATAWALSLHTLLRTTRRNQ